MPKPLTFLGLPAADAEALAGTRVAIVGASEASPDVPGRRSHSADAPAAIRRASQQFAKSLGQYDFDLDATLFPDKEDRRGCVDLGDIPTHAWDGAGNRARIRDMVARVLAAGAVPFILGGDDSVPIPALAAYDGHGPLTILQIDAHVDWADVLQGNAHGYGSTMRRASEYPWVVAMIQVGIRGLGSGERWQHDDARAWGSQLVTSYQLHEEGVAAVLDRIEPGARVFVSIDCDGLDPALFPAVNMPTPGGIGYEELIRLLRGVAARAKLAGLALVEYVPSRDDRHDQSALLATRILSVAMGLVLGPPAGEVTAAGGAPTAAAKTR